MINDEFFDIAFVYSLDSIYEKYNAIIENNKMKNMYRCFGKISNEKNFKSVDQVITFINDYFEFENRDDLL